jgi:hypothetical protein
LPAPSSEVAVAVRNQRRHYPSHPHSLFGQGCILVCLFW